MAAIQSKHIRMTTHNSSHLVEFHNKEDPYKDLTSNFPQEQDRILDTKLEKLMLDGCLPWLCVIHSISQPRSFLLKIWFKQNPENSFTLQGMARKASYFKPRSHCFCESG